MGSEPDTSMSLPRVVALAALGPALVLATFIGLRDEPLVIDLSVSCEVGAWKNVYELVASEASATGWDYLYVDPAGGENIGPGHDDHPSDPGLTDLELVVVDRAQETGICTATSEAVDQFGGDITFTMGSVWEEHSVPFSRLKPWSDHHWKGTQPGYIDISATVNGATVSERRDIYFSGCT